MIFRINDRALVSFSIVDVHRVEMSSFLVWQAVPKAHVIDVECNI